MLNIYYKIGHVLYRLRYLLFLLLVAAVIGTVRVMFGGVALSERFLLPALVLCTWLVLCLTFAYHTATPLPEKDAATSWLDRFFITCKRGFSYFLAFMIIGCTLALLWVSSTTLRLFLQS